MLLLLLILFFGFDYLVVERGVADVVLPELAGRQLSRRISPVHRLLYLALLFHLLRFATTNIVYHVFPGPPLPFFLLQLPLGLQQRHRLPLRNHHTFDPHRVRLRVVFNLFSLGPGMLGLGALLELLMLELLIQALASATVTAFVCLYLFVAVDEIEVL